MTPKLTRWAGAIDQFDFELKPVKGTSKTKLELWRHRPRHQTTSAGHASKPHQQDTSAGHVSRPHQPTAVPRQQQGIPCQQAPAWSMLLRSQIAVMDQRYGETDEAYQARMLAWSTETKRRANDAATAAKKKAEDAEQARLLAIEQQRQHDEAAAKTVDEERVQRREKIFSREQTFLTIAADWQAEAENGKMEDRENKIALRLSHLTDLLATCITHQEDIHSLDDALTQVHGRLRQLEQRPVTAPDASSSNTSNRLEALEMDVGSLKDGVQLQQTATQRLEQRICTTANNSSSEPRETTPKFDGQEIFCDSTKTDPIPWFKFELTLQLHYVKEHKHHAYLYSRSGDACQAWLDNLLSKYGVVAADLHTKISWDDLKAAWHKRFEVEPPEIKAMDKLMVFEQGTLPNFTIAYGATAISMRFVLVYLDDILVYSRTLEDHLGHLRRVLETLRRAKYKANRDKCEFVRQELEYLGHFVTPEGISSLSDKIQAIQEWSEPRNVTDVRSFLGLVGYYQRFIKGYLKIAARLTKLQCEDRPFDFGEEARESFLALKAALLSAEVLCIYDPLLPTRVTTDASGYGIAVLEQHDGVDWHPVEYFSKKVPVVNSIDDARKKEFLAFVHALKRWRHFLLGQSHFRWFDFFPDHIPRKSNRFADALSRRPDHCTAVYSTFEIDNDLRNSFIRDYQADPEFRDKYANFSSPNPAPSHYRIQEGYLLVHTRGKDLLCAPSNPHLRTRLLGEFHDAPATGHFGVNPTIGRLRERFWWSGLLGDVTRYCKSCEVCRRCKSRNHRSYGELRPLPVPLRRREAIAMDIIGPFPKHKTDVDGILTVVDRLTKFTMFLPCRDHAKAPELVEVLYAGWIRTKGYPKEIVCDRDTWFMSDFWLALIKRWGSSLKPNSARHPQTNGQTERAHQTTQVLLRTLIRPDQKDWVERLLDVELAYNSSIHPAIEMSPFEFEHGSPVTSSLDTITPRTAESDDHLLFLRQMQELFVKARDQMAKTQQRISQQANRQRLPCPFRVGDLVWVSPVEFSLEQDISHKLLPKWMGPWPIVTPAGDAHPRDLPSLFRYGGYHGSNPYSKRIRTAPNAPQSYWSQGPGASELPSPLPTSHHPHSTYSDGEKLSPSSDKASRYHPSPAMARNYSYWRDVAPDGYYGGTVEGLKPWETREPRSDDRWGTKLSPVSAGSGGLSTQRTGTGSSVVSRKKVHKRVRKGGKKGGWQEGGAMEDRKGEGLTSVTGQTGSGDEQVQVNTPPSTKASPQTDRQRPWAKKGADESTRKGSGYPKSSSYKTGSAQKGKAHYPRAMPDIEATTVSTLSEDGGGLAGEVANLSKAELVPHVPGLYEGILSHTAPASHIPGPGPEPEHGPELWPGPGPEPGPAGTDNASGEGQPGTGLSDVDGTPKHSVPSGDLLGNDKLSKELDLSSKEEKAFAKRTSKRASELQHQSSKPEGSKRSSRTGISEPGMADGTDQTAKEQERDASRPVSVKTEPVVGSEQSQQAEVRAKTSSMALRRSRFWTEGISDSDIVRGRRRSTQRRSPKLSAPDAGGIESSVPWAGARDLGMAWTGRKSPTRKSPAKRLSTASACRSSLRTGGSDARVAGTRGSLSGKKGTRISLLAKPAAQATAPALKDQVTNWLRSDIKQDISPGSRPKFVLAGVSAAQKSLTGAPPPLSLRDVKRTDAHEDSQHTSRSIRNVDSTSLTVHVGVPNTTVENSEIVSTSQASATTAATPSTADETISNPSLVHPDGTDLTGTNMGKQEQMTVPPTLTNTGQESAPVVTSSAQQDSATKVNEKEGHHADRPQQDAAGAPIHASVQEVLNVVPSQIAQNTPERDGGLGAAILETGLPSDMSRRGSGEISQPGKVPQKEGSDVRKTSGVRMIPTSAEVLGGSDNKDSRAIAGITHTVEPLIAPASDQLPHGESGSSAAPIGMTSTARQVEDRKRSQLPLPIQDIRGNEMKASTTGSNTQPGEAAVTRRGGEDVKKKMSGSGEAISLLSGVLGGTAGVDSHMKGSNEQQSLDQKRGSKHEVTSSPLTGESQAASGQAGDEQSAQQTHHAEANDVRHANGKQVEENKAPSPSVGAAQPEVKYGDHASGKQIEQNKVASHSSETEPTGPKDVDHGKQMEEKKTDSASSGTVGAVESKVGVTDVHSGEKEAQAEEKSKQEALPGTAQVSITGLSSTGGLHGASTQSQVEHGGGLLSGSKSHESGPPVPALLAPDSLSDSEKHGTDPSGSVAAGNVAASSEAPSQ
ncbi:hypothetical protein CBR_g29355 [Chara braunii]|uniref:Integrase catalytic domain-containing protein n=1 Tax=Chara braunii TaxID=69332 RepID=A0A388JWI2_CHABU|nr:hypothetical protein CBR_g29355 [Chara braunii]|eukprot:GBG62156.1 hypothetical protein CBR_g29355 [Chara braunii]